MEVELSGRDDRKALSLRTTASGLKRCRIQNGYSPYCRCIYISKHPNIRCYLVRNLVGWCLLDVYIQQIYSKLDFPKQKTGISWENTCDIMGASHYKSKKWPYHTEMKCLFTHQMSMIKWKICNGINVNIDKNTRQFCAVIHTSLVCSRGLDHRLAFATDLVRKIVWKSIASPASWMTVSLYRSTHSGGLSPWRHKQGMRLPSGEFSVWLRQLNWSI